MISLSWAFCASRRLGVTSVTRLSLTCPVPFITMCPPRSAPCPLLREGSFDARRCHQRRPDPAVELHPIAAVCLGDDGTRVDRSIPGSDLCIRTPGRVLLEPRRHVGAAAVARGSLRRRDLGHDGIALHDPLPPGTMGELVADPTGYEGNGSARVVILWVFLAIIIAGSFACIQVLNEAIKARQTGNIVFMILVEIAVAMFEVLFLYRELVDAMTPWLAQQGIQLGVLGTIGLAFFGWVGVRGMTWFLFGRFGAPALIGLLGRQAFAVEGSAAHGST